MEKWDHFSNMSKCAAALTVAGKPRMEKEKAALRNLWELAISAQYQYQGLISLPAFKQTHTLLFNCRGPSPLLIRFWTLQRAQLKKSRLHVRCSLVFREGGCWWVWWVWLAQLRRGLGSLSSLSRHPRARCVSGWLPWFWDLPHCGAALSCFLIRKV